VHPTSSFVGPLLTDYYQISMAYAYWHSNRHECHAVFDLFFRRNPFEGEFTVFSGLEEVVRFVSDFRFTPDDVAYIRSLMPGCEPAFFEWLASIDCSRVRIHAIREGTVVFPRIPLLIVEGPLAICQLLETTLLTLVNYASLVTTNAARFRIAAGPGKSLLEFGLRRAQGPDGGISASRYSYIGGFDATSNVLAGRLFGVPVRGTHAHAFVTAFTGLGDIETATIQDAQGRTADFVALVRECREELGFTRTHEGELASFAAYAQAFPHMFLALVDTYDTLKSGVPNFLTVALALHRLGYSPVGIRLDSGDLAFLSRGARGMFREVSARVGVDFGRMVISASNDINEETLLSLNQQGHEIDTFGVGTHLVTCQAQPALGCVYKMVELDGTPRIKLSQDVSKVTIPGKKEAYRLIGHDETPLLDLLIPAGEEPPRRGQRILCRHPFDEAKRAYVTPSNVIPLHEVVWDGRGAPLPTVAEIRARVADQIAAMRKDHIRALNPTPYKVSVSATLYEFIHGLWLQEAPITEIT
jgi:nicotinate phosphoribosyltransferase